MEQDFLSFLYPDRTRAEATTLAPVLAGDAAQELGLSSLLPLGKRSLSSFLTSDPEVIAYRQDVFSDLLREPRLAEALSSILPMLCDITDLRRLDDSLATGDSYLYSITEVELYISCIDRLAETLLPLEATLESEAFRRFTGAIRTLSESDYYRELNKDLTALASKIHEVKSVTFGVNLDSAMRPVEAGVLSVNASPFKSGRVLDKILRLSFKNDAMTTIAPLIPYDKGDNENRKDALRHAFHAALDDVFRSSVRAWRDIVGEYVLEKTDFLLEILPEIELIVRASSLLSSLKEKGLPLAFAEIRPLAEKAFEARGLYNPDVALRIEDEIVTNDLSFDDDGRLFLITGPNRGGKSVITCAVGLAQALFQLGLPVPAEEAALSPVSGIFTHFPSGADDTIDKGRLGEECARLREIFDRLDENGMILLDEALSSTGSYEASLLASEIVAALAAKGVRGLFSTHLHELAGELSEINRRSHEQGGITVDTLVAGIEEGRRSFKICRAKPDGKSYAKDIADRYGLSFDRLTGKREST